MALCSLSIKRVNPFVGYNPVPAPRFFTGLNPTFLPNTLLAGGPCACLGCLNLTSFSRRVYAGVNQKVGEQAGLFPTMVLWQVMP